MIKQRSDTFKEALRSGQRVRNHQILNYIDPRKLEYPDIDQEEPVFSEYKDGVTGYGEYGLGTIPDKPLAPGFLLQENGDYILQENLDKIKIMAAI